MKKIKFNHKIGLGIIAMVFALFFTSCESELDKDPITEKTESQAFAEPESYEQFLAKIYGGWAINGHRILGMQIFKELMETFLIMFVCFLPCKN